MKTIHLRLILDVNFDPNGVDRDTLVRQMHDVVNRAVNDGTLTGETPATVEHYNFKVVKRRRKKRSVKKCKKCGSPLNQRGRCCDITCPYSDHPQSTALESLYEPNESKAIINNYPYGVCPDCGWKIRKNVKEGDDCRNCGHVFYGSQAAENAAE